MIGRDYCHKRLPHSRKQALTKQSLFLREGQSFHHLPLLPTKWQRNTLNLCLNHSGNEKGLLSQNLGYYRIYSRLCNSILQIRTYYGSTSHSTNRSCLNSQESSIWAVSFLQKVSITNSEGVKI